MKPEHRQIIEDMNLEGVMDTAHCAFEDMISHSKRVLRLMDKPVDGGELDEESTKLWIDNHRIFMGCILAKCANSLLSSCDADLDSDIVDRTIARLLPPTEQIREAMKRAKELRDAK